jgi:HD-GYP domain-containing protein (c-di-GMP phosphodiesterase class II)
LTAATVKLSSILSGLSYALDLTEGSVPNRVLDKPGTLSPREWEVVKLHPYYTYQILERVPVFGELAFDASAHHERLDGSGYHRNLSAERPYRGKLPRERVTGIMKEEAARASAPTAWPRR